MKGKKWLCLCLSLVFTLSACSASQIDSPASTEKNEVQEEFDQFMKEQLVNAVQSDYYTLHSTLVDPENYGIDESKVEKTFGRLDQDTMNEQRISTKEDFDALKAFDVNKLTEEQKDTYETYMYELSTSLQLSDSKFDYISSLFSPMTGLHVVFPQVFSDWDLYDEQDARNLILMVDDVDDYTQSAIDYTYTQNEKGYLCLSFDEVMDYSQDVLDVGTESSVLQAMEEEIKELELSDATEQELILQLQQTFSDSYLHAYQMILDAMNDLKEHGNNHPQGLASFDVGKEYYSLLFQTQIGSDKSVEDVESMMKQRVQDHQESFLQYVDQDNMTGFLFMSTPYESYDEILKSIQDQMGSDFPAIEHTTYEIRDMEEDIATNNGVAAYYLIPPIDGSWTGQLRVNPLGTQIKSIDTYTTVAHEGLPGHMYQFNYARENIEEPMRWSILGSVAYQEGYATYAQYYSLRYLDDLDSKERRAYKELMLYLYDTMILVDIGIHYYGWDEEECAEQLEQMGIPAVENAQYEQLLYSPCAFEPYYVGYEEIMTLREQAREALGSKFKDIDFHTALLEAGAAPFSVVERHVERYIQG